MKNERICMYMLNMWDVIWLYGWLADVIIILMIEKYVLEGTTGFAIYKTLSMHPSVHSSLCVCIYKRAYKLIFVLYKVKNVTACVNDDDNNNDDGDDDTLSK